MLLNSHFNKNKNFGKIKLQGFQNYYCIYSNLFRLILKCSLLSLHTRNSNYTGILMV